MRVSVVRWRTGQLKALGHFENGNFRYIVIGPVAEDFGQKNDILKNFSRNRFGACPDHSFILSCRRSMCLKNKRRSIGKPDERLCSTEGSVDFTQGVEQPSCQ
jgi:hypothetical protein